MHEAVNFAVVQYNKRYDEHEMKKERKIHVIYQSKDVG
jgi:hypothetical protein